MSASLGLETKNEPRSASMVKRTTCVKCPDKGAVVLNGKDVYCRKCLLHYVSHKFRSTLGKQKIFKSSDKVLVAVSGGVSSTAMEDLIKSNLDENEQKKLKISPIFLHLVENPIEDGCETFCQKSSTASSFPFHVATFSSIFEDNANLDGKAFGDDVTRLRNLFNSVKNETARRDLYKRLKFLCLVRIARQLEIPYLMVGDNCTNLSTGLMAGVVQGRGSQIKDDVGVIDKRWPNVTVIRPLRELQIKELSLYNFYKNLQQHFHDSFLFGISRTPASIQSETEDFVVGLQQQFPATICTLFSTASKLASVSGSKSDDAKCKLCSSEVFFVKNQDHLKNFCYGCRSSLSEISPVSLNLLPNFLF